MSKPLSAALILAIALATGCSPIKAWERKPNRTVELARVVDAVKQQVDAAKQQLEKDKIGVDICEEVVSVQTIITNTQSADFQVLIFKPVGKHITTKTTTVSVDLVRVEKETAKNHSLSLTVANNNLTEVIVAAAKQYAKIKDEAAPGLQRKDFTVDVSFAVEWDGTAGLTFQLFGNGADVSWELDDRVQHEVVLTFTLPGKCPK
jgi:hypothetical protein